MLYKVHISHGNLQASARVGFRTVNVVRNVVSLNASVFPLSVWFRVPLMSCAIRWFLWHSILRDDQLSVVRNGSSECFRRGVTVRLHCMYSSAHRIAWHRMACWRTQLRYW